MLTDDEYREIMANKSALQSKIDATRKDYDSLTEARQGIYDTGMQYYKQMSLYTNFLNDAIKEYEATHQPEGE